MAKKPELDIFDSTAIGDAAAVDEAACNSLWYCAASRLTPSGVHECAHLLLDGPRQ